MLTLHLMEPTEEATEQVSRFLIPLVAECAVVEPDPRAAMEDIYGVLTQGMTYVVRDGPHIVGCLALEQAGYRYRPSDTMLQDAYFFVSAPYRGGAVGAMLMKQGRAVAESLGKYIEIRSSNPRQAGKKLRGRVAEKWGYFPTGFAVAMGTNEHG